EAPYAAPEQRAGTGRAATADDLWSAGMVIYRTVTGREVADRPDLSAAPALQPIHDVFSGQPPSALEVLDRLREPDPMRSIPAEPDLRLEEGRVAFDRAHEAKREPEVEQPSPVTRIEQVPQEPPRKWWARWLPLAVLAALVVVVWMVIR
ncbi:hypothetical protein AB0392_59505, partial [Nonomuraea angiospora]